MQTTLLRAALHTALALVLTTGPALATLYEADIRTTSYGISHVKADDWGSLGFGYGYVYANHNFCILAEEVVEANGQQARYFGDSTSRVNQDFFYTLVNNDTFIDDYIASVSPEVLELARGYAAGYNRYLAETGVSNLPEACRDAEWVRSIDERDLLKVYYKLILRASAGATVDFILDAVPPSLEAVRPASEYDDALKAMRALDWAPLRALNKPLHLGSNMYALGANATQSGKGMLLGNPHFSWEGPLRWYEIHLTIPGEIDVMGASLQGVPLVNIGFNRNVAWSHTVSPAWRFALFELVLVPGNPTRYQYDGGELDMEQHTVSIEVKLGDGTLETRNHTFYRTVHGWVMDLTSFTGFSIWQFGSTIFALGDANENNTQIIDQFRRMNQAASLDDFIGVIEGDVGLPWVHTVAADEGGDAYFGDMSVVPNVDAAKLAACPTASAFGPLITDLAGIYVLDGRTTACRFGTDVDSPRDGIFGAGNLPSLRNRDYVANSNDNHWLTNPDTPLTGFSPLLGTEETNRNLRTRLGLVLAQQRIAGTDGLGVPGFTLETLQEVLFGSRNYVAEMVVDDLATVCTNEGPTVDLGGGNIVDVSQACTVLANWDKRQNIDSVGPQVLLEMLEALNDETGDDFLLDLFANPFDVADPVNTPNGLNDDTQAARDDLMRWLAQGVDDLNTAGVAVDAVWGDIQYSEKNGVRYPIHGGRDGSGMFSIITADLGPNGYTPIEHGNSYMQTVTWDDDGVVAEALLSYSQSSDPANANYADQTALYANKQWVSLPFTDAEIAADPNFSSFTLIGPRENTDSDGDGVDDSADNCVKAINADQRDTDGDGIGNLCDADFDQDCAVEFSDLNAMKLAFFALGDLDTDMDGDGETSFTDLNLLKLAFFQPPGPSGTANLCD